MTCSGRIVFVQLFPIILLLSFAISAASSFQGNSAQLREYLRQAQMLQKQGELEAAYEIYQIVLPDFRQTSDLEGLAEALNSMAAISISLGRYTEALALAREASEIARELGNPIGEAQSEYSQGVAFLYLGDYTAALGHYRQALSLDRNSGNEEGEILRLNDIANVHYYEGAYYEALSIYQEALRKLAKGSETEWKPRQRRLTLHNLAVLYQKLGLNDRALDMYRELRESPDLLSPSEEAQLLTNQGVLFRHLGDPAKALEHYQQARELFAREEYMVRELGVLRNIGILMALDLGNLEEAEKSFREVLNLAAQSSNLRNVVHGHLYLGEVERRLGRFSRAREELEAARRGAIELGTAEELWKSLYGLALIAEAEGYRDKAVDLFEYAIEVIESVRSRLRLASLKPGFLADKRDVYGKLIGLKSEAAAQNEVASDPVICQEIFDLMERARSRTFQDQMRNPLQRTLLERHPEASRSLIEIRAQLARVWRQQIEADDADRDLLQTEFNELENRYIAVESQLANFFPEQIGSRIALEDAQKLLDDSTLLVEIWMGQDFLSLLWLSQTSQGVLFEPFGRKLPSAIAQCLGELSDPTSDRWGSVCQPLNKRFSSLLVPLLESDPRTVVLVADGALTAMPFEALHLADGRFLIERVSIHYLPSASLLREAKRPVLPSGLPWKESLVAFGDPLVDQVSEDTVEPLPFSRREVQEIARQLTGSETLYLGSEARKEHLIRPGVQNAAVLHLSTHASVDMENSDRSRILFSPQPPQTEASYLFLGEVLNLELEGNSLVTLSACDTSRGTFLVGEGLHNFSRAFLLSGADATVTSLWRVSDQPTAEFMKQFYYFLGRGYSKTEALRQAKIRFLNSSGTLAHPYYWAAFILHGDGHSTLPLPMSWTSFLTVVCAAALLLLLVVRRHFAHPA